MYHEILQQYWGYEHFRSIQLQIIQSIGSGHDTLGLMPTGGGKSLTFQVPALAAQGVCIVITPLISLMKDQVSNLRERGILAGAIYTGLTRREVLTTLDNCIYGGYKLLYISPERLSSDLFLTKLQYMHVSFVTVDEAHCISQWGYDFRPAYLQIATLRASLPGVPILALTATATPRVVQDIQDKLLFTQQQVFQMSFERANLSYRVLHTDAKPVEMLRLLRHIPGTAIVYTRSRRRTEEIAELLTQEGMTALHYHAGLTNLDKDVRQRAWQTGQVRIMVATNAFGMGIDKANVRLVIHIDVPDSLEAYFQEAGRAGRDGAAATSYLLYNRYDEAKFAKRVEELFPPITYISQLYEHLAYYLQLAMGDGQDCYFEFHLHDFCRKYHYFPLHAENALRLLTKAGYIEYVGEEDTHARLMFVTQRDILYRMTHYTKATERVLRVLLRLYTGLFSEYVVIHEAEIAGLAKVSTQELYGILVSLTQQGIVHYIPCKRVAHIRYTMQRVASEHIVLPPEVYTLRREDYIARIQAVIHYAKTATCRSIMLLTYFGQEHTHTCGTCDVCLGQQQTDTASHDLLQATAQHVLQYLAVHGRTPISTLRTQYAITQPFSQAVAHLVEMDKVYISGSDLVPK